jgi:hypothetical protein
VLPCSTYADPEADKITPARRTASEGGHRFPSG